MALFEAPAKTKTGLRRHALPHPSLNRQRKAAGLVRIPNPVLPSEVRTQGRLGAMDTGCPYNLHDIANAYAVDCYMRQGIDKYAELILKEGWYLSGSPEVTEYLRARLDFLSLSSGVLFENVIHEIVREFSKFGNSFVVQQPFQPTDSLPLNLFPLSGKTVTGGLYTLPANQMTPFFNKETGRHTHWIQSNGQDSVQFPVERVMQITYCKPPGALWGLPPNLASIDDIRALRFAEENVLKLMDKYLNPLIHQEVPDITHTGEGRQEDVDQAAATYQQMAPDGFIITPPNHKIHILGMESKALRVESYLQIFKKRVYAGLGVSELIMGETKSGGQSSADSLTAQMHQRAKYYQAVLSYHLTHLIFFPLLMEGGFSPWSRDEDRVTLIWNEIEIDRRIKEESHTINQVTSSLLSMNEGRKKMGLAEMTDEEYANTYLNRVQIPLATSVHRLQQERIQIDGDTTDLPAVDISDKPSPSLGKTDDRLRKTAADVPRLGNQNQHTNIPRIPEMTKQALLELFEDYDPEESVEDYISGLEIEDE